MSLRKRLPTAFILIAIVYVIIQYLPLIVFFLALQLIITLSLYEFYQLSSKKKIFPLKIVGCLFAILIGISFYLTQLKLPYLILSFLFILAVYYLIWTTSREKLGVFPSAIALTFFGVFYIAFTLNYLFLLQKKSSGLVLLLLTVVYLGDTGAYAFGTLWGKKKMTPLASPNKTWEGALGGILFAVAGAAGGKLLFYEPISFSQVILAGLSLSIIAQISDPVESLFKRAVEVKDSSRILPGHGGMLDRIDSLILAAPFFYYYITLIWKL